jgi:hypothetical protein
VKVAWRCQKVSVFGYVDDMSGMAASVRRRVLIVEDEPLMAEAIRDGLRLAAIAADTAGDGDTALELLNVRALDRRRAHHRPPAREIAGLRLDPLRREVHRNARYVVCDAPPDTGQKERTVGAPRCPTREFAG